MGNLVSKSTVEAVELENNLKLTVQTFLADIKRPYIQYVFDQIPWDSKLVDELRKLICDMNQNAATRFNLCVLFTSRYFGEKKPLANLYGYTAYLIYCSNEIKMSDQQATLILCPALLGAIDTLYVNENENKDVAKHKILELLEKIAQQHGTFLLSSIPKVLFKLDETTGFFKDLKPNELTPKTQFAIFKMLGNYALKEAKLELAQFYFLRSYQLAKTNNMQMNDSMMYSSVPRLSSSPHVLLAKQSVSDKFNEIAPAAASNVTAPGGAKEQARMEFS